MAVLAPSTPKVQLALLVSMSNLTGGGVSVAAFSCNWSCPLISGEAAGEGEAMRQENTNILRRISIKIVFASSSFSAKIFDILKLGC